MITPTFVAFYYICYAEIGVKRARKKIEGELLADQYWTNSSSQAAINRLTPVPAFLPAGFKKCRPRARAFVGVG
jgi:hypothetical protein